MDEASRVANSDIGADLMKESEAKGLKGLAFFGEGEKNLATNFPVSGIADLKGKRLRVIPTPVLLQQVRDWGANPVPVEFSETYGALQSGTVVGQEQQWGLIHDLKFFEVSKYLTETRHGMLVEYFFVSKRWFDRLPKDLQEAIVAEAKVLIPVRLEMAHTYTRASVEKLKAAKGVQFSVLPAAQREEFVKAAQPTYEAFVKTNGKPGADLIDRIRRATGR
jgi:TRAP-type C4-dicarboxylate transport system substrate-binding protein